MPQKRYTKLFFPRTIRCATSFWLEAVANNWKCYLVWSHVMTSDKTVFNYYNGSEQKYLCKLGKRAKVEEHGEASNTPWESYNHD